LFKIKIESQYRFSGIISRYTIYQGSSMLPETIADRAAIADVMLKYAAGVDERDLNLYRSCFSNNVEILNFGSQTYQGIDNWTEYVWSSLEKYQATQHMLGPSLITMDGDKASVRTDVQALHYLKEGGIKIFTLWATYKT
jgi:hypothetical protein